VALPADFLLPAFRPYASLFGDPAFFRPRLDLFAFPFWTNLYDTAPLRATLTDLLDLDALADRSVRPHLLLTATDIEAGQIRAFDSAEEPLTLDHIVASGSLPPNFPMTVIGDTAYWDGGLFDNTPLGAVIERMNPAQGVKDERQIVVVNLFPNRGEVPATMADVGQRILNLLFANKTRSDLKLLKRFNGVAALLELIESDDRWKDLRATEAYAAANRGYITVPNIIEITRIRPADGHSSGDFSPATIAELATQGAEDARAALLLNDEGARPDESRAFG
jgi:predicted acylesterase/phospholipase RssA